MENQNSRTQSKSIVDFILSENKKQEAQNQKHLLEQLPVMNAYHFFNAEDGKSIGAKAQFLSFINNSKDDDLRNLESFLEMMNRKTKFNVPSYSRKDKAGNDYYWVKVIMPNGIKEFKIILFEGMDYLIQGYLHNNYRFELSLAELYEEAHKA